MLVSDRFVTGYFIITTAEWRADFEHLRVFIFFFRSGSMTQTLSLSMYCYVRIIMMYFFLLYDPDVVCLYASVNKIFVPFYSVLFCSVNNAKESGGTNIKSISWKANKPN